MKNIYSDIKFTPGLYAAGIYSILIAPREWLLFPLQINFATGIVDHEVHLAPERKFLQLDLVPDSYVFEEKPKESRGGPYFQTQVQGNINNITPELYSSLSSITNHEVIAILYDKRGRKKIVGTHESALNVRFTNKEDSSRQGGIQIVSIDLSMDTENLAPFYDF